MSETVEIILRSRNGIETIAIVSPVDADLAKLKWGRHNAGYPKRSIHIGEKNTTVFLHRLILERIVGRPLLREELADHKDRNPLNNTRENLRLANRSQNAGNSKVDCDSKSGYKGVSWAKKTSRWQVVIRFNGIRKYLGTFINVLDAARAYNAAALEHFGEFARPNIIPLDASAITELDPQTLNEACLGGCKNPSYECICGEG